MVNYKPFNTTLPIDTLQSMELHINKQNESRIKNNEPKLSKATFIKEAIEEKLKNTSV